MKHSLLITLLFIPLFIQAQLAELRREFYAGNYEAVIMKAEKVDPEYKHYEKVEKLVADAKTKKTERDLMFKAQEAREAAELLSYPTLVDGRFIESEVIQVEGNQDELLTRAKSAIKDIANRTGTGAEFLEIDVHENMASAKIGIPTKGIGKTFYWGVLTIRAKDNRYKYELTSFTYTGASQLEGSLAALAGDYTQTVGNHRTWEQIFLRKDGSIKDSWKNPLKKVKAQVDLYITDVKKIMATPVDNDDW